MLRTCHTASIPGSASGKPDQDVTWGCASALRFEDTMSFGARLFFCLSAPSGMGIGMGIIAKWELEDDTSRMLHALNRVARINISNKGGGRKPL
eukprot:6437762-Amphidinium_carterae.2